MNGYEKLNNETIKSDCVDVDECSLNVCENGSCENLEGSYSCSCNAGWAGNNCDQDINECVDLEICGKYGTCFNEAQSWHTRLYGLS